MHWLDWIFVIIPLFIVIWLGIKSQRYVRTVTDFLTAGRVAGRYVVAVASGEAGVGLISLVAMLEQGYQCGFAISFWSKMTLPLTMFFGLVGYCTYRYRESRAMTFGQLLEMRYSRKFRVFAAIFQILSGLLNYAIFPAVGARFLIYFLDLPHYWHLFGMSISTYATVMALNLLIAVAIDMMGGQITIMVTDCIQGILSYPMYAIIVIFLFWRFSWGKEMVPVLTCRAPDESFLNPMDIKHLRDFNLFYVIVGIVSTVVNAMGMGGTIGYLGAAKNPHEQKMGNLLGTWRSGFSGMMYTLLAVVGLTFMNHFHFANEAKVIRTNLANKVAEEILGNGQFSDLRPELAKDFEAIPAVEPADDGQLKQLSQKQNQDTPYFDAVADRCSNVEGAKSTTQQFRSLYGQMLIPVALREIFPIGITGIFCALCIFLMISTDTTYMHSWASVIIQDLVVPFRKKTLTPHQHLWFLRCSVLGVAIFAYFFSLLFAQMDYIIMFFQITGAIWLGGAGVVIVFGLYTRRGSTAGAFAGLGTGGVLAVLGFLTQNLWPERVYPFLVRHNMFDGFCRFLAWVSKPLYPWVDWTNVTPHKFPINSMEIQMIAMISSIILYWVFSLLIPDKELFNLDKMLHRGKYADENSIVFHREPWSLKSFMGRITGITSSYTLGDKILSWSVFFYSFVYTYLTIFLSVWIWNIISPWPAHWWTTYYFVTNFAILGVIGVVSTVWFTWGGSRDLYRLFRDLANKKDDFTDNGQVRKDEPATVAENADQK